MEKAKDISEIIKFMTNHPESNVSRRIFRETFGSAPGIITSDIINSLRYQLEISDELIVEGYKYLVR